MYNNDIEYQKYLANQERLEELEKKEIKRQHKQLQVEWNEIKKQSEVDKW